MFLTDFHMQKYTGGIISWVGIFLTVTPGTFLRCKGRPNKQNTLQETSPSGSSQSSGENGESMVDGDILQLIIFQDSKFQKVYLLKILIFMKANIQTQRDILLWLEFR